MATESIYNAVFVRVVDNKAIVIQGINDFTVLRLLGTTVPTSVVLTRDYASEKSIILYPVKGEEGVVALGIRAFNNFGSGKKSSTGFADIPVFLKITWNGDVPHIDLKNPWYPANRIGQITGDGYTNHLEVALKGKRFSSVHPDQLGVKVGKDTLVPGVDGNLLCRYLWGTASASDVLHAAVEQKLEPVMAKRVEQLTRDTRRLEGENHRLVEESTREIRHLEEQKRSLEDVLDRALSVNESLSIQHKEIFRRNFNAVERMRALRDRLRRFPRWLLSKASRQFLDAMSEIDNLPKK